jgi:hypothetical protein
MADMLIRYRLTVYASSTLALLKGEFIVIFPPGLLVAVSAVMKH